MMKIYNPFFIILSTSLLFSCSKDTFDDADDTSADKSEAPISFTSSIQNSKVTGVDDLEWELNDTVSIYLYADQISQDTTGLSLDPSVLDETKFAGYSKYTAASSGNYTSFDPVGSGLFYTLPKDYPTSVLPSSYKFLALKEPGYYENLVLTDSIRYQSTGFTNIPFSNVLADQESGMDFLYAKDISGAYNASNTGPVELKFQHRLAKIKLTFIDGDGTFGPDYFANFVPFVSGIASYGTFNLIDPTNGDYDYQGTTDGINFVCDSDNPSYPKQDALNYLVNVQDPSKGFGSEYFHSFETVILPQKAMKHKDSWNDSSSDAVYLRFTISDTNIAGNDTYNVYLREKDGWDQLDFVAGKSYEFVLTFTSKGFIFEGVVIEDWIDGGNFSFTASPPGSSSSSEDLNYDNVVIDNWEQDENTDTGFEVDVKPDSETDFDGTEIDNWETDGNSNSNVNFGS